MNIGIKRAYEPPAKADGYRVLVDRMWPRGKKKDELEIQRWIKSIAPSTELRKWFAHDPAKWSEFKKRYLTELREHKDELTALIREANDDNLTLVYGAKDERHNNAVVLREYLRRLAKR